MLPIHSIIHGSLGVVGFVSNVLLIMAIFRSRRNTFLQTYSLLLFNSAVADLVASVTDAMTMARLVVDHLSNVHIYSGPCAAISESVCFLLYSVLLHVMTYSIKLIAVSFWYRSKAVSGNTPTIWQLQAICCAVLTPSVIVMIQFLWAPSPRDEIAAILTKVYPHLDTTTLAITGIVSTLGRHAMATNLYCCVLPIIAYSIIIAMRRQVKRKLSAVTTMSDRTKEMHETLIKALTVHAFLPLSLVAGVGSFVLLSLTVSRSELMESFVSMGGTFPSVVNPLITLYFVLPLRRSLCHSSRKVGQAAEEGNKKKMTIASH